MFFAWWLGIGLALQVIFLIPIKGKYSSPKSASDYLYMDGSDFIPADERDTMFSRNTMRTDLKQYEDYYREHPERKEGDDKRRKRGGPLGKPGSIDGRYRPNVAMVHPDAEVSAGAVEVLVAALDSHPDVGVVGPLTRYADGAVQVSTGPDLTPRAERRQRRLVPAEESSGPRGPELLLWTHRNARE